MDLKTSLQIMYDHVTTPTTTHMCTSILTPSHPNMVDLKTSYYKFRRAMLQVLLLPFPQKCKTRTCFRCGLCWACFVGGWGRCWISVSCAVADAGFHICGLVMVSTLVVKTATSQTSKHSAQASLTPWTLLFSQATHIHICVHMHVHIHMYIQIHMHMYTHTRTHTREHIHKHVHVHKCKYS